MIFPGFLRLLLAGLASGAPKGVPILPPEPFASVGTSAGPESIETRVVPASGQGFKSALEVSVKAHCDNSWDLQVRFPTSAPVAKGDTLHLSLWMRCTMSKDETGEGRASLVFETVPGWHKSLEEDVTAGHEWRRMDVPFTALHDMPAGGGSLNIRLGYGLQTVELGEVRLTDCGKSVSPDTLPRTRATYRGMEKNAPWRKAARERILRYRTGELAVTVRDAAGKPVPGALVRARMARHAYLFGSETSLKYLIVNKDTPDGRKYREWIPKLFNTAVEGGGFKWDAWEGQWGPGYTPENSIASVRWLREQGLTVRGHVLVWPSWRYLPKSLRALEKEPAALRKRILDHIREEAGSVKGMMAQWDVVNEPFDNHDLLDILGREAMVDWFREAHATDPDAALFLNDYALLAGGGGDTPHRRHFDDTVRFLLASKAPLDALGIQGHFGSMPTPPEEMLKLLDRYAAHGLPLYITEFDHTTADEEFQGRFMRDLLTVFFSHPATKGFVMWGFWDGCHWKDNSPIFRRDWSVKPAGKAWMDLVLKEWWTDAEARTDSSGRAVIRGFLGDYSVAAKAKGRETGRTAAIAPGGSSIDLTL